LIEIKARACTGLPERRRPAKMRRMSKRRSNSLVAWFAVAALLLCQAAGLVQARVLDWTVPQAQGGGCHSAAGDERSSQKTVHIPCDAAQTVGETFKLPTITPALLPFAEALIVAATNAQRAPPVTHIAHAGAPPPLHLLYARLRN
jgi:hypothetical protein